MDENPTVQEEAIIPQEEPTILEALDNTDDVEAIKANAEKMETFARQTLARAKKAEIAAKAQGLELNSDGEWVKKPKETPAPVTPSQASVEETILLANGMPENLLEELKAIAAVRKTSLIKAQTDPLFVAAKDIFEKEKKQKEASLPASRGSGQTKVKKDFNSPGLSRDEHREMIRKAGL